MTHVILETLVTFVTLVTLVTLESLGNIKTENKLRTQQAAINKMFRTHVRAAERVTDMRLGVTHL